MCVCVCVIKQIVHYTVLNACTVLETIMILSCYYWLYIGLRNDHKKIMTLIEDKLHHLHTTARETGTITSGIQRNSTTDRIPFASITTVTIGSPAAISVSNYTVISVQGYY